MGGGKRLGTRRLRVLICGDRWWTNEFAIWREMMVLPRNSIIIHGCARGADMLADKIAKEMKLTVMPFPAKWSKYGNAAGRLRNRQMLKDGRPDRVLAFHPMLHLSTGTLDMVTIARAEEIPVEVFTE